jgi:hypothetical protein
VLVAALLGQVVVRVLLMASPSIRSVRRIEPAAAEAVTRAG